MRLFHMIYLSMLLPAGYVFSAEQVTAQQFVNLQQGNTSVAGFRRAHAKGACVTGYFEPNGQLSALTQVPIFALGTAPFIGRFSIAGNNPTAPDLKSPVRSLAVSFNISPTQQWRIAMNTPPVMAVSNPHDFYQQIVAIQSGPQALKAFFNAHPETQDFLNWKASYTPAQSLALERYHSINAFYLENSQGEKRAVRWYFEPLGHPMGPTSDTDNALFDELSARLLKGPVKFNWVFILSEETDDENDPALRWPENREHVVAGKIVIEQIDMGLNAQCQSINYDPLTLPSGVTATADPILRARSAAYAESYRRRAKEKLLEVLQ
nr:catalase family peroxidase [Pseudoalteromonas rubra]